MYRYAKSVLLLLVIAIVPACVGADVVLIVPSPTWQDIPLSTRAMGMGGAYSGVLEGPEAAWWNPAVPLDGRPVVAGWSGIEDHDLFEGFHRWSGQMSIEFHGVRLSAMRDRTSLGPMLIRTSYLPEGTGKTFSLYETQDIVALSTDVT